MANADITTTITQADAFVVVSWWQDESSNARKGHYSYEHCASLNEASCELSIGCPSGSDRGS